MLVTEWDWDECLDVERKEAKAEGLAEGRAEGRAEGEEQKQRELIRKFSNKLSPDEIAETLQVTASYVYQVLEEER